MSKMIDVLELKSNHNTLVGLIFGLLAGAYFINFYVNDIWTPNESFYAEAVREMFESGNFLDILYNYEPRYNKPPLTYWLMALPSAIFGVNEFALRLPMVLLGLGSIWYTYLLGKFQFGKKGGLYAMMMMGVSAQLLAVKQYASPEIPLTFFFVASLYHFLKGYQLKEFKHILIFYILCGMAVLVKGYPYIVVIGGIVGLFILLNNRLSIKAIWKDLGFLKPYIGLPLVLVIGLSWVIFMYMKDGQDFWLIYKRETFDRAFTRKESSMRWGFYFEVMAWTIIPYSIAFYYASLKWLKDWKIAKPLLFSFCWLIVMLVVFTFSKGKLPTYFIQAHPAMICMIIPLLIVNKGNNKIWNGLWKSTFVLPALIIWAGLTYMIYELSLSPILYAFSILGIYLLYLLLQRKSRSLLVTIPFGLTVMFLITFASYMPKMEKHRPYDEMGHLINQQLQIDKGEPLLIQNTLIHNMPFYAERKVIRDQSPSDIQDAQGVLAMVREESLDQIDGYESLWSGYIYDSSSESQFLKFVLACRDADNGDFSKFAMYHLIRK